MIYLTLKDSISEEKLNKTKFILIILSIVFAIADIAWSIYNVVSYFMLAPALREPVFYAVYDIIVIAVDIAVVVMLILCIWGNGNHFRSRYGLYVSALVISVITNLTSISTILLICTMFISDWVWVKKVDNQDTQNDNVIILPSKEEMITRLRERKEKGEITEDEFQEELMKLL